MGFNQQNGGFNGIYPLVMTIPGKLMVFYGDLMGINGI